MESNLHSSKSNNENATGKMYHLQKEHYTKVELVIITHLR